MLIRKKFLVSLLASSVLVTSFSPFIVNAVTFDSEDTVMLSEEQNLAPMDTSSIYNKQIKKSDDSGRVVIIDDPIEGPIVRKYENTGSISTYAMVSRWGKWEYTKIAVSTGVAAGAINSLFALGIGANFALFGLPGWAIGGLLEAASWTKLGSYPGREVAKFWDKNGNGWIGFYTRKGYDAVGRHTATDHKTN
jgi:hypothetical protein